MAATKKNSTSIAPRFPRASDIKPAAGLGVTYLVEQVPPSPAGTSPAISDWRISRATSGEKSLVPPLDTLVGRHSLLIYEKMSTTDACVRSCLSLLRASVCGAGWRLEPGDDSGRAHDAADLITGDLEALPGSFDSALAEILSALTYGFSCTYKVWSLDGRVAIRKLQTLHPASVEFRMEPDGTLVTVTQQGVGGKELDPARLIHFVHEGWFGNVRGWSILRPAFSSWWMKQNVAQWMAQWMEKLSNPPVLVRHPAHTQEAAVTSMLQLADRLQARTSVSLPDGFDLALLETSRIPKSQFVAVLNHLDQQIARACLTHDMSGFSGGPVEGGSYALSLSQERMFLLMVEGIRRNLEACITEKLLRDATIYGFGPGVPVPKFRLLPIQEENKLAIASVFQGLVTSGAITPGPQDEAHLRKLLSFPEVEASAATTNYVALKERASGGGGAPRKGAAIDKPSPLAQRKGGEGRDPASQAHAGRRPSPSSSSFAEGDAQNDQPATTWRPLTMAEERAEVLRMAEEADREVKEFASTLAAGTDALVADLKAQVEAHGEELTAEKINGLTLNPALVAKVRQDVEDSLLRSYTKGRLQAERVIKNTRMT